jgi:hypothetical protein
VICHIPAAISLPDLYSATAILIFGQKQIRAVRGSAARDHRIMLQRENEGKPFACLPIFRDGLLLQLQGIVE